MKLKELKQLPQEQLQKLLEDTRHELYELRLKLNAGELKNVTALEKARKTIARISTLLKKK